MLKTILVIGGLGYLGGRICESLLRTNKYKVIIGTRNINSDVPKELMGCKLVSIDLLDINIIKNCLKGIDIIIHLAAMNVNECDKNPSSALLVNGLGTLNLVQSIKHSKVKKIIYFSSAHVYGSPLSGDINEDKKAIPKSHYAITHRTAEDYIIKLGSEGKIFTSILRLSNAVGYPIRENTDCWMLVANDLAKQIVENSEIILNSSGKQLRDFIPISSITYAVNFFLESQIPSGEVYNLGSGKSLSIIDFANLLSLRAKIILGLDIKVSSKVIKDISDDHFHFKIDKIKALGYSPQKSLNIEIDRLLRFVDQEFRLNSIYSKKNI
jgi:UDP-glucose 4-epimerase